MTAKEALQLGIPIHPTIHHNKRRANFHDYTLTSTYMLTMVIDRRRPLFGSLICPSEPQVDFTTLAMDIINNEFDKINKFYPNVEVWDRCLMPDHLHVIVHVAEPFPKGKHLGSVVSGFKVGCNHVYYKYFGYRPKDKLFESGYNDRILYEDDQIDRWKDYLRDNARRLWLKRQNRNYFTVLHAMDVVGVPCHGVGNRDFLQIPDKMAVIVHRSDTPVEIEAKQRMWLDFAEGGGILVSAAISQPEKNVMREAMNRGYNQIVLRENAFPPYYKPSGEAFDACAQGRLLQICPWEYHNERRDIMRRQCEDLNDLALLMCGQPLYYHPYDSPWLKGRRG